MTVISITGGDSAESFSNFIPYTVTLSATSLDPITVSYRTLRSTALDFDLDNAISSASNNGLLTFAPGEDTKTILIEAESDTLDERDEFVVVELFNPSANATFDGGTPVLRSSGVIFDNDGLGSNLSVLVSDPVLVEGDSGTTNAVFEIRLSQAAGSAFSMSFETYDISAKAGSDYTDTSGNVNFAADQTVAFVSVPVIGDTVGEAAESFGLIVTPPGNVSIGTEGAVGEATILDTDTSPLPELSIEGDIVVESFSRFMRFTVTLSEPSLDAITVDYRTLRGTASDFDLDNAITSASNNGSLTFTPGQTTLSIFIEAESDTLDERDEEITLELFNPSNNVVFPEGQPVLRSTGVILDNDGAGSNLAVFVSDPVLIEGDSGQREAVFEVRLSQPASSSFSLSYQTKDISAEAGSDYTAVSGTLDFVPGQEFAAVHVPVFGDTHEEYTESFALVVAPPGSPSIGTDGAVGEAVIIDDDTSAALPELSIEGDFVVESFSRFMRFTVTLSEPSLDAISVNYRTLRDTAQDFDLDNAITSAANNNILTFSPGETSKSFFIEAESDSLDERDENITVELFNPTANVVFAGGTPVLRSTGVILDNDGAGSNLAIFVSDPVITEGDSGQKLALFELRLSQPAASEFVFAYETADGTAVAGEDYVSTTGSATFLQGQETAAVYVPIIGDTIGEAAETFSLVVTPPASPSIGSDGAVGEALILDTDTSTLTEISIEGDVVVESFSRFLRFTVTLSEPAGDPVTVSYRTMRDTGGDFDLDNAISGSSNNGTLTFAPGETTKAIFIEAESDSLDERDENITLELFHPSINAVFSGGAPILRSEGILLDNDGAGANLAIHVSDPILVEGSSGTQDAVFELRLSRPASTEFTVSFETFDITAEAGVDYEATSGTVTFKPGQDLAAVFVPVIGDNAGEASEQFSLVVTPPGSPSIGTDGAAGVATILDTDSDPLPEISIEGDVVVESFSRFLRYTVTLSEESLSPVLVDFEVIEGVAVAADLDNGLTSGTLTFSPGEITKSIFIEAESDSLDERDESIHVRLTNPVNGVFPQGEGALSATGFILDNDGLGPNRAVSGTPTQVLETGAAFTDFFVDVSLSSPASQALLFDASLISLTGTVGTDIELLNSQVAFRPGETTAAVKVRVFGDADETEGVETVELELTPATGIPFVGSIPNTLITIGDGIRPTDPSDDSDVIFGTPGDDVIDLRAGNDDYRGFAGDDEIEPGLGNDTVDGGFGDDTVTYEDALGAVQVFLNLGFSRGADGRDDLSNVEGIIGSAFGDRLTGDSGANVLNGLAGDDILKGKGGLDSYFGGDGDDRVSGGNQDDTMFGEADDDQLSGLSGSDFMDGGIGNDSLF